MDVLRTMLPERITKLIEMQVELHSKNKGNTNNRYSDETKDFALSLYHISGSAYRFVSKFFCLLSKRSLLRWVSGLSKCPGINDQAMQLIHSKVEVVSEQSRLCTITMDEMSIKANFSYDSSVDEIVGLGDYGNGSKGNEVLTSALVFMARGKTENWKQPFAYYLAYGFCKNDKVKELLMEMITKVSSFGLNRELKIVRRRLATPPS